MYAINHDGILQKAPLRLPETSFTRNSRAELETCTLTASADNQSQLPVSLRVAPHGNHFDDLPTRQRQRREITHRSHNLAFESSFALHRSYQPQPICSRPHEGNYPQTLLCAKTDFYQDGRSCTFCISIPHLFFDPSLATKLLQ